MKKQFLFLFLSIEYFNAIREAEKTTINKKIKEKKVSAKNIRMLSQLLEKLQSENRRSNYLNSLPGKSLKKFLILLVYVF